MKKKEGWGKKKKFFKLKIVFFLTRARLDFLWHGAPLVFLGFIYLKNKKFYY